MSITSHQAMKEALESVVYAIECGKDHPHGKSTMFSYERIEELKQALTLTNSEKVEDITHLINQVRHLHD